jgi:PP-loop superfamily ATP-utilizing enzyme
VEIEEKKRVAEIRNATPKLFKKTIWVRAEERTAICSQGENLKA